MGYRPPKGVRPPQLEGKRTGRPKGSMNLAPAWRNILWAYEHRYEDRVVPPNVTAYLWWTFARSFPYELEEWLIEYGQIPDPYEDEE